MGNTPAPCNRCKHLYYDAMSKDDPNGLVECHLGAPLGVLTCPRYEDYQPLHNYTLPKPTRAEIALCTVLDGVQAHDIHAQTGIAPDICDKIDSLKKELEGKYPTIHTLKLEDASDAVEKEYSPAVREWRSVSPCHECPQQTSELCSKPQLPSCPTHHEDRAIKV